MTPTRRVFFGMAGLVTFLFTIPNTSVNAFSASVIPSSVSSTVSTIDPKIASNPTKPTVAYKTVPLPLTGFGINAPLAVWYPVSETDSSLQPQAAAASEVAPPSTPVKYDYQISVRRIGELLARWDFIPGFVTRKFTFERSNNDSDDKNTNIHFVDGKHVPLPTKAKVVVLTHGFLGSRFDLSHIAEDLAARGFVCVAPEYPESLEASYPRLEGLDRKVVNDRLFRWITDNVKEPTSFASIGHSMGAGTALDIGDDSWDRVLMGIGRAPDLPGKETDVTAKFPMRQVGGRLLFISSVNDGAVKWGGGIRVPDDYTMLSESQNFAASPSNDASSNGRLSMMLPDRAALVFDRSNAPNHISFLSENVNEAMISFLAPLLPVAQAFDIPVLDFDKYVVSRDSVQTAEVLKPLIAEFLLSADKEGVDL
ncbi:dienelactone hydrolase family protein [Nitzschia inconspicua]|uniref:Dienelactone hydrolase family protein n=1 Tax=Nitzschia inconspicua TaxID=303405 RepID=A0A9K3KT99_9STRA|nr:dienelactone hydrolase family protein [Nitzschia inconspicua]